MIWCVPPRPTSRTRTREQEQRPNHAAVTRTQTQRTPSSNKNKLKKRRRKIRTCGSCPHITARWTIWWPTSSAASKKICMAATPLHHPCPPAATTITLRRRCPATTTEASSRETDYLQGSNKHKGRRNPRSSTDRRVGTRMAERTISCLRSKAHPCHQLEVVVVVSPSMTAEVHPVLSSRKRCRWPEAKDLFSRGKISAPKFWYAESPLPMAKEIIMAMS
mmetsp:Transcript_1781/g.4145  ORF Transcript_1781/g.4145 Transcript_1781/m.4145 type:complete len:220 (-) Transcript_1781:565-1224(-)